ncbi:RDD family protein [Microbacterium invictum]|uniref:RDD family membrane protein YckC n=1 Tax=Microbacterium invictum TaxID=515415 RepID=A0AA40VN32_9MICO|nr:MULTISPECIES: RDD family protein [Microbacterium]MBB4140374.1 putative RDD family membrane protein YckC [Microbacterium invictum]
MTGRPAELGRRVMAYVIDGAIAGILGGIVVSLLTAVSLATQGGFSPLLAIAGAYLALIAWFFVYTFMQGGAGSIGMRLLGLELAHIDGDALGFGRALGRNLVWAGGSVIIVGMFSPLFDQTAWHRGWHDQLSGAVMTDVRGVPGSYAPPAVPLAPPLPDLPAPQGAPGTQGAPGMQGAPGTSAPAPAGVAYAQPPAAPAHVISPQAAAPAASLPPSAAADSGFGAYPAAPAGYPAATANPASPGLSVVDPASPETPAATVVAPPRAPQPQPDGPIAFVPGVTSSRAPAQPEPRPVVPDEVPVDETRMSTGARAFATLVWDDGARHALYGRTLFGRNPTPETGAHVAPIRDETLSLSKTHFEVGPGDGSVWIVDRHSTNGVVIRRGAQTQAVTPGERATVYAGDILEIGDRRITIEVGR